MVSLPSMSDSLNTWTYRWFLVLDVALREIQHIYTQSPGSGSSFLSLSSVHRRQLLTNTWRVMVIPLHLLATDVPSVHYLNRLNWRGCPTWTGRQSIAGQLMIFEFLLLFPSFCNVYKFLMNVFYCLSSVFAILCYIQHHSVNKGAM